MARPQGGNCAACGLANPGTEQPDPCLGKLPDTRWACCGHGYPRAAYHVSEATRPDGSPDVTRGYAARRRLQDRGGRPAEFTHPYEDQTGLEFENRWPGADVT